MRITVGDLITRACILAASVEAGPLRGTRWLRDVSLNSSASANLPTINRGLAAISSATDVEAPASTLSTLPESSSERTSATQGGSNVGNSQTPLSSSREQSTIVTTIAAPKPSSSPASPVESTTQSAEPGFSISPSGFTTSTTVSLGPSTESTSETASSTLVTSSAVSSSSAATVTSSPGSSAAVSSALTPTLEVTSFLSGTVVVSPPPPKTSTPLISTGPSSLSTSSSLSSISTSAPVISTTAQAFPNVTSSSLTTTMRSNGTLPTSFETHSPTGTPNTEIPTGVATLIPSPTKGVNASIYEKNLQQARHLNLLYSKLTPDSACNEGQAACVVGGTGICSSNGAFDIYPCSPGTSCVAVPINVTDGVILNCLDRDTAQSILGKNATIFFPTPGESGKYTKTVSVTTSAGTTMIVTATATVTVPEEPSSSPTLESPSSSLPLETTNSVVTIPSSSSPPPASQAASTSEGGGGQFTGTATITKTTGTVIEIVTETTVYSFSPDPSSSTTSEAAQETPTSAAAPESTATSEKATAPTTAASSIVPPPPAERIQTVTVVSVSTATATETVTTTDIQTTTTTQPGATTVTATVTAERQQVQPGDEAGRADKSPTPPATSLPPPNTVVPLPEPRR